MVETVITSPTAYPVPPLAIVAPTATPPLIVTFAVPLLPSPLTLVKVKPSNVHPPELGV